MQLLTNPFTVILSEEMLFNQKLDFFNSFSKKCGKDVSECKASIAELEKDHRNLLDKAAEEVKNDHQQLMKDIDSALLVEISKRVGIFWPDLGISLIPNVLEEELTTSLLRVASTGIDIWECLGKIYPFFGKMQGLVLGVIERIAISVVVFLDIVVDSLTKKRVEGFLTWDWKKLSKDVQESNWLPWKAKAVPLQSLKNRVQELMKDGDWKSVLEKDPKATSVLREYLQQAVTKLVREKKATIVSVGHYGVPDKTQDRRKGMTEELNIAKRVLEELWVQKMCKSAFQVCEAEKELATCVNVLTAEADGVKRPGGGCESGGLKMVVKRFWKDGKKKTYLEVEAEAVQVAEMEVKVRQLVAKKDDVEVSGGEAVIPCHVVLGKLQIPCSHKLVGGLLLKGRLLYVVNHPLLKGKRSALLSYDFHNGVKKTLQSFPRPIRLVAFDDQLRLLALYVLEKEDGEDEGEAAGKEKRQRGLPKSVEGVDEGLEAETEPDSDGEADSEGFGVVRSDVAFYRFDENWSKVSSAGKPCELLFLPGQPELQHLAFLPGGHVAAMLDTSNRIRLYQVRQQCVLTSQQTLPPDFCVASLVATPCGQCLTAVSRPNVKGEVEVRPFASHSLSPLQPVYLHQARERGKWLVASFLEEKRGNKCTCAAYRKGEGQWSAMSR